MNSKRSTRKQELSDDRFGLHPGELRLVLVGPEWVLRFVTERERILRSLGHAILDVQHIGSTAIPGIYAKPILDIAVAISDFEAGHALVPSLVSLGYAYLGENGIPRRHYFVRGNPESHHLHIFERQSADWPRHLNFRDRLLADPALASRYSQLKLAAAKLCSGDRQHYQDLKSTFIQEVEK